MTEAKPDKPKTTPAATLLSLAEYLARSGKITATTLSLAVVFIGTPYAVKTWVLDSDATARWLDIQAAAAVSETALAEHAGMDSHALAGGQLMRHQQRLATAEARIDRIDAKLDETIDRIVDAQGAVEGVRSLTVGLCIGLNSSLDLGIECQP